MSPLRKTKGSTRIDLRIPDTLLDKIRELAIENNAPIHHISNKPELTGTIINLLEKALSGNTSDSLSDNYHDATIESLKGEFKDSIAALKQDFEKQLRELKSLPLGAVSHIEATTQPEPLPLLDALETAIAVETLPDKEISLITEILPSQDAQISHKNLNQNETPLSDAESLKGLKNAQLSDLLGIRCTYCDSSEYTVKEHKQNKDGSISHRYRCKNCAKQFSVRQPAIAHQTL